MNVTLAMAWGTGVLAVSLAGLAHGQASTVTQQYLGAPVPNPVVAVELDAAPSRALPAQSGAPGSVGMPSAGQPAATYGERIQSQTSPPMYTGAGSAGGAAGVGSVLGTRESDRR